MANAAHKLVTKFNFSGIYHTQQNSHVPQFKDFLPLSLNFKKSRSIISEIYFLTLKVSSVKCSNPLLAKGTIKVEFCTQYLIYV